jgi:hypothetical protein
MSELVAQKQQTSVQIDYKLSKKPHILLTTTVFEGHQLWTNGLHQNCLFLYKLFEHAGFIPIFLSPNKPTTETGKQYRVVEFSEYDDNPFPVYALIEIGIKCLAARRKNMGKKGTKLFKLFLGNSLNIDIETPIHTQSIFEHHISGSHGTMLLSPHYYLSQDFISALYDVYKNVKIAPYVWDPVFIQDLCDIYEWSDDGPYSFTIMEPNISFQKCSLIPILICESYYRAHPENMDGAVVINGDKIMKTKYFFENVLSKLDIHRDKRLFLIKRLTIREAATTFKQNIVIHHAVNNDYNYLFLEYLFMGFPVIHNYSMLKEYGYYYEGDDIEAGKQMIHHVIYNHGSNLETYRATCHKLIWKFSINNPDNVKGWCEILDA